MPNADLRAAIEAHNRADRKDALFHLVLAVPTALFGIAFANVLALPLLYLLWTFGLSPGLGIYLLVFNLALLAFIVVDLRRHPEETWHVPRYTLTDGSVRGHEFGAGTRDGLTDAIVEYEKPALLSGMPLMTNMSDPRNAMERGRAISNGFANLILGGPRSIQKALGIRRRAADRSRARAVQSAERFMAWLGSKGVVPESEVQAHLAAHPDQAEGLALAREVEVVTRRRLQAEFHYQLR